MLHYRKKTIFSPAQQTSKPKSLRSQKQIRIATTILVWFTSSIYFNHVTPNLCKLLPTPEDVTFIELMGAVICGALTLPLMGLSLIPHRATMPQVTLIGITHLISCRAFVYAVAVNQISVTQTIRACNPMFTVIFSRFFFGQKYSFRVKLSVFVITVGFGVSSLSNADFVLDGILAAVLSVSTLVITLLFLKRVLKKDKTQSDGVAVHEFQMQFWICCVSVMCMLPHWLTTGGTTRLYMAITNSAIGSQVRSLIVLDGVLYFIEQNAEYRCVKALSPLSTSVVDTIRRMCIVVIAGLVLQRNAWNIRTLLGAFLVASGAIYYSKIRHQEQENQKKQSGECLL